MIPYGCKQKQTFIAAVNSYVGTKTAWVLTQWTMLFRCVLPFEL